MWFPFSCKCKLEYLQLTNLFVLQNGDQWQTGERCDGGQPHESCDNKSNAWKAAERLCQNGRCDQTNFTEYLFIFLWGGGGLFQRWKSILQVKVTCLYNDKGRVHRLKVCTSHSPNIKFKLPSSWSWPEKELLLDTGYCMFYLNTYKTYLFSFKIQPSFISRGC